MSNVFKALFFLALLSTTACTQLPYVPFEQTAEPGRFRDCPCDQFERGRPNKFIDGIGHYFFSLPTKLLLWDWDMENHDISCETEVAIREYIEANHLDDVKVRINQYAPGGEWQRLGRNKRVGAGWRYTFGAISVLLYTILPERVFGGDNYNPYTNTINLYSDVPAVALHEAGHAKDFAEAKHPGTYAALAILPLTSLWFEAQATGDALGYLEDKRDMCAKKEAYKTLYPAYGTYIGGEAVDAISLFTPIDTAIALAAVIPGHIVGRYQAAQVDCAAAAEPTPSPSPSPLPEAAQPVDSRIAD